MHERTRLRFLSRAEVSSKAAGAVVAIAAFAGLTACSGNDEFIESEGRCGLYSRLDAPGARWHFSNESGHELIIETKAKSDGLFQLRQRNRRDTVYTDITTQYRCTEEWISKVSRSLHIEVEGEGEGETHYAESEDVFAPEQQVAPIAPEPGQRWGGYVQVTSSLVEWVAGSAPHYENNVVHGEFEASVGDLQTEETPLGFFEGYEVGWSFDAYRGESQLLVEGVGPVTHANPGHPKLFIDELR